MKKKRFDVVKKAVTEWAKVQFKSEQAVVYIFNEGEKDRYIAAIAVPHINIWQAAEAWVERGRVVATNWLGEGLPPEDVIWPWAG